MNEAPNTFRQRRQKVLGRKHSTPQMRCEVARCGGCAMYNAVRFSQFFGPIALLAQVTLDRFDQLGMRLNPREWTVQCEDRTSTRCRGLGNCAAKEATCAG